MTQSIGLIINPMAGRDIRRLVAYASLQSGPEKALTARRILAGVLAVPGIDVLVPDDEGGFFAWLVSELGRDMPISLIPSPLGEPDSTTVWVQRLIEAGAEALIVVGGDGTQRNAAQAHPSVPILPVAGGTNNVACYLGDQTAGGYACARYLTDHWDPKESGNRAKVLHIALSNGAEELALIDVALTRQTYTGAMAVWRSEDVDTLVLTRADTLRPGLSSVGGFLHPVDFLDDFGLAIRIGPQGSWTPAILAPGLMSGFLVEEVSPLDLGQSLELAARSGGTLALDGERTVVLSPNESVLVTLERDGPWILDPQKILGGHG